MADHYLILGSGIAGFSAAKEIRRLSADAEVTMVGAEPETPYLRPLLNKTGICNFQRGKIRLVPEEWYEENRIRLYRGCTVQRIDRAGRRVLLADGRALTYNKCIYALGAACFVPPIPGCEKHGVLTLRNTQEFAALRRLCMTAKTAVLIGGGVIGLETACQLHRMGIACTILEAAPRLMARLLDAESSAMLAEKLRGAGIACFAGVQVAELTGETAVTGVQLADGRWFAADLVVISAGVRAVTGPALASGLRCGRGVLTDDALFTSDPDILAAGDCIECGGPNPGLWNYARMSGEAAGHNAVCPQEPRRFAAGRFPVTLSVMGTELFAMGEVEGPGLTAKVAADLAERPTEGAAPLAALHPGQGPAPRRPAQGAAPLFRVNPRQNAGESWEKRFYRDGGLCGAVLMGDLGAMGEIQKQLGAL